MLYQLSTSLSHITAGLVAFKATKSSFSVLGVQDELEAVSQKFRVHSQALTWVFRHTKTQLVENLFVG